MELQVHPYEKLYIYAHKKLQMVLDLGLICSPANYLLFPTTIQPVIGLQF